MREVVRDKERLYHILESINRLLTFAEGKSKEDLQADSLIFFGIVKNIEIIGEASHKLTWIERRRNRRFVVSAPCLHQG